MKKILFFCITLVSVILTSCEKDLPIYDDPQGRLNFYYASSDDSIYNYSFNYHKEVERDTIWLEVRTSGIITSQDRYFELQQLPCDSNAAQPGIHYVSFDDPEYKQNLVIRSGQNSAKVPIIVLKDKSLSDKDYTIRLGIKDNGTFVAGDTEHRIKVVNVSDRLTKPTNWSTLMLWHFGHWSQVKHQFMINHSDALWDDEYLLSLGVDNIQTCDQNYLIYLATKMRKALEDYYNSGGEYPLMGEDGKVVKFENELYD